MPASPDRVHSVTTARTPRSEDRRNRARNYFIAMGIRTVCFIAACVTATVSRGVLMWVFIVLAVVLPYIAVVIANATNYTIGSIEPATGLDEIRQIPPSGTIVELPSDQVR